MTDLISPVQAPSPLMRHPIMETDSFCNQCGYNLHGQVVSRDERLNLLVVRCPECGTFHSANHASSARHLWLRRIGVLLVGGWIAAVLCFFGFMLIICAVMQDAHLDYLTTWGQFIVDGQSVRQQVPRLWSEAYRTQPEMVLADLFAAAVAFSIGAFFVTGMWHAPRYVAWFLLPLIWIVAAMELLEWSNYPSHALLGRWSAEHLAGYAAFQTVFVALGIVVGRPLARGVVRLIIPPRPRQALAFLWRIDGKMPPGAGSIKTQDIPAV